MKKDTLLEIVSDAFNASRLNQSENPLENWTCFVDNLDAAGRRRIGDQLEAEGKSRFTGQ